MCLRPIPFLCLKCSGQEIKSNVIMSHSSTWSRMGFGGNLWKHRKAKRIWDEINKCGV